MTQATIARTPKSEQNAALLRRALARNNGPRDWRQWKEGAAWEFIELVDSAPRMDLLGIFVDGDFRVNYQIAMPVPRTPEGGRLRIANRAVFHMMYLENWRWETPPTFLPLSMLDPDDVFHPNCRPAGELPFDMPAQMPASRAMVCLGRLPPCISPKEIALLGYFAVTLQDRAMDELDPEGVFNPQACQYYRDHDEYLPLTRAGLLDPWPGSEEGGVL